MPPPYPETCGRGGVREAAPLVKLYKETGAQDRVLSEEECALLFDVSSLHLGRLLLCAYETGMRAGEIKKLTWDKVNFKTGLIRLSAEDTQNEGETNRSDLCHFAGSP